MNWRFWNTQEPQRPTRPEPTPPCPKPPARVLKVDPPRPWPPKRPEEFSPHTVSASASSLDTETGPWRNLLTGEVRVLGPSPWMKDLPVRHAYECEQQPGGSAVGLTSCQHPIEMRRDGICRICGEPVYSIPWDDPVHNPSALRATAEELRKSIANGGLPEGAEAIASAGPMLPAPTSYLDVPIYSAGEKVRAAEPFVHIPPIGPINGEHLAVIRSQPTLGDAGARVQLWVYMDGELKPGSAYVRDIKRTTE